MSENKRNRAGGDRKNEAKEQEKRAKSSGPACVVCLENKELVSLTCGHAFCRTCIQYHIEAELNSKGASLKVFW